LVSKWKICKTCKTILDHNDVEYPKKTSVYLFKTQAREGMIWWKRLWNILQMISLLRICLWNKLLEFNYWYSSEKYVKLAKQSWIRFVLWSEPSLVWMRFRPFCEFKGFIPTLCVWSPILGINLGCSFAFIVLGLGFLQV
jgi:hypothetical protein